jgi:hypothetical protein
MMTRNLRVLALCLVGACSAEPSTQVLTGRVAAERGALAVRAIADGEIIAAAPVRTDGVWTISLPEGKQYRLEVLTRSGVKHVVDGTLRDVTFKVCDAGDPYDTGGMGDPPAPCDPTTDQNCAPCDPMTGANCQPPTCDPMTDPSCQPGCTDPTDPNCQPPTGCENSMDPNCQPGCTDPMDPNCQPPGCTDPMDPTCGCMPLPDGTCCYPDDPNCGGGTPGCDPNNPMDPNCPPPPGCENSMDPSCQPGCNDPTDPNCCMPQPEPCDANGMCDPGQGMTPDNLPDDFGCANE